MRTEPRPQVMHIHNLCVCVCVCVCACIRVCKHISENTHPHFTEISVRVVYGRGLVLLLLLLHVLYVLPVLWMISCFPLSVLSCRAYNILTDSPGGTIPDHRGGVLMPNSQFKPPDTKQLNVQVVSSSGAVNWL